MEDEGAGEEGVVAGRRDHARHGLGAEGAKKRGKGEGGKKCPLEGIVAGGEQPGGR
jgi:hypothetical protein